MKKIILYVIITLASSIMTASAIAMCPFSYTVYLSGAKVLDMRIIEGNPQNPNIKYGMDNRWVLKNYFSMSEDEASCSRDQYGQATIFQVTVGSEATPLNQDGSSNLKKNRAGRNCILTVIAGPNQNLELVGGVPGGVNCTDHIQLDVTKKENPLNLDMHTGTGEEHNPWAPHWWPPLIGWCRFETKTDSDFVFYPKFITP